MKKQKTPGFIVLIILTSITVLFWVSFSIYQVFTTDPDPVIPEEVIQQLDPRLDTVTVNEMKNRIYPER